MPRNKIILASLAAIALIAALLASGAPTGAPLRAQNAPEKKSDPFPGWNQRVDSTHLDFTHYWGLAECYATAEVLCVTFPELVTQEVIGHSYEGRPLIALTVTSSRTGPAASKPAMYLDSNIHGSETQGTEIIFLTLWHLLRNYGREDSITKLLDTRTFYLVPVVNVDSRFHWFTEPNSPHTLRHNWRPRDDDRDGRADEDGPDDIDGDGRICVMRIRDPEGDLITGTDRRTMVPRGPEQPGEWRLLGMEGSDNDGDGRVNEDGPGGVDLNRNFPFVWKPEHIQHASGEFPGSEYEIRACSEFLVNHPNIAAAQFYHNTGRMVLRSPSSASDAGLVSGSDRAVYDTLGRHGERMLPGYRYMQTHDELYAAHGSQIDFAYLGVGRFSFTNELWGTTGHDINKDGRVDEAEELAWYDDFGGGRTFTDWHPFHHPQYGDIEIGGKSQFSGNMPPALMQYDEAIRNALFTLYHAACIAELGVRVEKSESLGQDLWRLRVRVRNTAVMPTDSDRAAARGTADPVLLRLAAVGGKSGPRIIGGCRITEAGGAGALLPVRVNGAAELGSVPGRGSVLLELLVRGAKGSTGELEAHHPRSVPASAGLKLE